jgi:hypothetical protein
MAELCGPVNAPLADAVERVTAAPEIGPIKDDQKFAAAFLAAELNDLGQGLSADFMPKAEFPGITICPADVLERDPPSGVTKEQVATGLGSLASKTVGDLIARLRVNRQGYARTQRGIKRHSN